MKKNLKAQALPKIIFTDFDGCLTDDRVWLNQEGEEFVAANRKDGFYISFTRLKTTGLQAKKMHFVINRILLEPILSPTVSGISLVILMVLRLSVFLTMSFKTI
jgi:predicted mannosyl-3-phosphoglycerate phosphatase (HAD superfamily)